jgi:hypothetical protein
MSANAKFVPVRMTLVPARPEVGNIVIAALVVKVAVALSKFFVPAGMVVPLALTITS